MRQPENAPPTARLIVPFPLAAGPSMATVKLMRPVEPSWPRAAKGAGRAIRQCAFSTPVRPVEDGRQARASTARKPERTWRSAGIVHADRLFRPRDRGRGRTSRSGGRDGWRRSHRRGRRRGPRPSTLHQSGPSRSRHAARAAARRPSPRSGPAFFTRSSPTPRISVRPFGSWPQPPTGWGYSSIIDAASLPVGTSMPFISAETARRRSPARAPRLPSRSFS